MRKTYRDPARIAGSREVRSFAGFTLLELLMVMGIIAILVAIGIPSYKAFRSRADKAVCISRMRVLHTALDSYMLDKKQWPQMPPSVFESTDENDLWGWWINTLEPYGAGDTFWICPADKRPIDSDFEYYSSYMPAQFNAHHFTPYRWAKQPWLIERGRLHKKGAHIMMPDGSIHNSMDAY